MTATLQVRGTLQVQAFNSFLVIGVVHILEYAMIQTADGWRIAGVQLLPAPDVGA